jgi:hypothetical protein
MTIYEGPPRNPSGATYEGLYVRLGENIYYGNNDYKDPQGHETLAAHHHVLDTCIAAGDHDSSEVSAGYFTVDYRLKIVKLWPSGSKDLHVHGLEKPRWKRDCVVFHRKSKGYRVTPST